MDVDIECWISEPKQLLTSHVCLSVAAILRAKLTNAVDADTFFLLSVADHFSCQQLQLASIFCTRCPPWHVPGFVCSGRVLLGQSIV